MLIVLAKEHKEHLVFLAKLDLEVVEEFGRISLEFLRQGANPKVYGAAAKKLGYEARDVQHAVEAIMYLLVECSRLKINDVDFHDSFLTLGLNTAVNKYLLDLYMANAEEIRAILDHIYPGMPAYADMHWRLDVQLASRSLRQQVEPQVVLQLDIKDADSVVMQTDPATLTHLTRELEAALKETRTSHFRKTTRGIRS
eukprot:UC1_evm1s1680